jgi:hypothetical protein
MTCSCVGRSFMNFVGQTVSFCLIVAVVGFVTEVRAATYAFTYNGPCRSATATAPFLTPLVAKQTSGLAGGDHDQEPPETVGISELGESPRAGVAAEAVESADRHVFFVRHSQAPALQFFPRQSDETTEVSVPNSLGGLGMSGSQVAQPRSDRISQANQCSDERDRQNEARHIIGPIFADVWHL